LWAGESANSATPAQV